MKNICASIAEIGELAFAPILFMLFVVLWKR